MRKKYILPTIALLGAGIWSSLLGAAGEDNGWQDHLARGQEAMSKGKYRKAFVEYLGAAQGAQYQIPLPIDALKEEIIPNLRDIYLTMSPCINLFSLYNSLLLRLGDLSSLEEILETSNVRDQAHWLARLIYRQDAPQRTEDLCNQLKALWTKNKSSFLQDQDQVAYLLAIQDRLHDLEAQQVPPENLSQLQADFAPINELINRIDANFTSAVRSSQRLADVKKDFEDVSIPEDAFGPACPKQECSICAQQDGPVCIQKKCPEPKCPVCEPQKCPACKNDIHAAPSAPCPEGQVCLDENSLRSKIEGYEQEIKGLIGKNKDLSRQRENSLVWLYHRGAFQGAMVCGAVNYLLKLNKVTNDQRINIPVAMASGLGTAIFFGRRDGDWNIYPQAIGDKIKEYWQRGGNFLQGWVSNKRNVTN